MSNGADGPTHSNAPEEQTMPKEKAPDSRNQRTQDILTALVFIAIAVALIWIAIPYGVQEPKKVKFLALSPSYYPRLIGYCLMAFGALLLVRQMMRRDKPTRDTSARATNADREPATTVPTTVLPTYRPYAFAVLIVVTCVLFAYFWFLPTLGFVLMSFLALIATQLIAGERSPVVIILIAVAVPLMLYFFFTKVANIPIPAGILETILLKF